MSERLDVAGVTFTGQDWGGRSLAGDRFTDCTFTSCDLSETTTAGVTFERCQLIDVRLNASHHEGSAFVGCELVGTSLFDAALHGCKLVGTRFRRCTLRPLVVRGGNWSFVSLRGADLAKVDLSGVNLV